MNSSLARACTLVLFLVRLGSGGLFRSGWPLLQHRPRLHTINRLSRILFNPQAINYNKNKKGQIISTDYGVMQINSKTLQKFRRDYPQLTVARLLNEPCLNIHVGAMVLRRNFNAYGATWLAVGMYNAGVKNKDETIAARHRYAMKIDSIYKGIKSGTIKTKVID